ncbi:hypothetical protein BKA70DRAFT_1104141, partial [Coprinopsis sp. MPI-PUGE-AT-0042]
LSGFLDLGKLSKLRRFSLKAMLSEFDPQRSLVVNHIESVLSTISTPNGIEFISLDFLSYGSHPWSSTRCQSWGVLCEPIAKISSGKEIPSTSTWAMMVPDRGTSTAGTYARISTGSWRRCLPPTRSLSTGGPHLVLHQDLSVDSSR